MAPYSILIRCPYPECANRDPQSVQFVRTAVKQRLDTNEDITVGGFYCGHSWNLTKQEKENARKAIALAEGRVEGISA